MAQALGTLVELEATMNTKSQRWRLVFEAAIIRDDKCHRSIGLWKSGPVFRLGPADEKDSRPVRDSKDPPMSTPQALVWVLQMMRRQDVECTETDTFWRAAEQCVKLLERTLKESIRKLILADLQKSTTVRRQKRRDWATPGNKPGCRRQKARGRSSGA